MLHLIVWTAVLLLAGLLLFAALKPKHFRVQRRTVIQAPASKVYRLVDDFNRWPAWSPWEHIDPNMQRSLSGAPKGLGAVYAWEGNNKAGKGRMEIMGAVPASSITIKLDFQKPFAASNITQFDFVPQGSSTEVSWTMHGPQPYLARLMTVFFNMERLVGRDFDNGLMNLKRVSEAA